MVVGNQFNVEVDAPKNPYLTMLEVNPTGAGNANQKGTHVTTEGGKTVLYNVSETGTGLLRTTKAVYSITTNPYTDMNFYTVSSSGVRQQWYTLRVYADDTDTTLRTDGLALNETVLTLDAQNVAHETLDDRKPVNLTVNTRNGLALVVLQDGEGEHPRRTAGRQRVPGRAREPHR